MDQCDALIVGAGPAGSTCAWALGNAGLDVILLESQKFPRNKPCAGWITPPVLQLLQVDLTDYARGRVLQPISGFRVGLIGDAGREFEYGRVVSYSIRRCEFDEFLARRSGARLLEETPMTHLRRVGHEWVVNESIRTPLVIGAGGHFCPVARMLGAKVAEEVVVTAQEAEFELDDLQRAQIAVRGEVPELFFSADLSGYGWCVRKQNFLNVGFGHLNKSHLHSCVSEFLRFLKDSKRLPFQLPGKLRGHAYLLAGQRRERLTGDGVLLIGDAAGVAYSPSGEGIRPAVESGLLAARTIVKANGRYSREQLEGYRTHLTTYFGGRRNLWTTSSGAGFSRYAFRKVSRHLLAWGWFARSVILDRWFLHAHEPALGA
jgi:flavin-dependent dehydrogenase